MFRNYRGLWLLLVVAFVVFAGLSFFDPITIGGHELKQATLLKSRAESQEPRGFLVESQEARAESVTKKKDSVEVDTASKTILFIGDSMLEGLSPRMADYAAANGHTLYSVIWYSSTSEIWGASDKLSHYVSQLHPDYIFICLGANELFVSNIADKRDKYVKRLLRQAGNIPYVWIGPPNWKPDTGINDLIAANTAPGNFFVSNGMHFDRSKDGAHPTRSSAALWMDSVARWMPAHAAHPIKMQRPADGQKGRPKRIFVHQPSER